MSNDARVQVDIGVKMLPGMESIGQPSKWNYLLFSILFAELIATLYFMLN